MIRPDAEPRRERERETTNLMKRRRSDPAMSFPLVVLGGDHVLAEEVEHRVHRSRL